MKEVTLPSGTILKFHASSFSNSKELLRTVLLEMKELGGIAKNLDVLILSLFSSPAVEMQAYRCFDKVTYGDKKLDPSKLDEILDSEKGRKDYPVIMKEVLRINLEPFSQSLFSELMALVREAGENFQMLR